MLFFLPAATFQFIKFSYVTCMRRVKNVSSANHNILVLKLGFNCCSSSEFSGVDRFPSTLMVKLFYPFCITNNWSFSCYFRIMKGNENKKWKEKTKNKVRKGQKCDQVIVTVRELNDFVVYLSFRQLICKAFKSNLELALSINLKVRELYESKHVSVDFKCLKIWNLSYLICPSILVLKWRQVSPV